MSQTPLTDRAIERLKSLCEGNGLAPGDVVLLGSEENVLELRAEMQLTLEVVRTASSYAGPLRNNGKVAAARLQKVAAQAQADEAAKALQEKICTGGQWTKETLRHLKEQPGQGWGIEQADITLDDLAQLTYMQTPCAACQGRGAAECTACQGQGTLPCSYCHATGHEPCINCNGSGVNATNPNQYCLYCNGSTQQPCRQCRGTRQMTCTACRGKAHIACGTCGGQGSFTQEDAQMPTAHARFHLLQADELPSGFRRALSRGGLKSLLRGHGDITMLPLEEKDKTAATVPYRASVPFAEARFKIAGKAMRASIFGKRGLLFDVPPFLDLALEPHIKALEAARGAPDSLHKALQWRVIKEALALQQQGRGDAKNMRALYPAGLSPEMATRLFDLLRALMAAQTKLMRLMGGAGALVLLGGLSYLVLLSGFRAWLAAALAPLAAFGFDVLFCALCVLAQDALLRYVAARQLQLRLGAAADVPRLGMASQKAGTIGLVVGALVVAVYLALLFLLGSAPSWPALFKKPFG